jgi:hypothetical protein
MRIAVVNAPAGWSDKLHPLPEYVQVLTDLQGEFDLILLFSHNQAELSARILPAVQALKPISLIWIAFPKGTSKLQTDLTRDRGWDVVQQADLKWINLISLDDDWSGFALRPYKPGEKRQSFR